MSLLERPRFIGGFLILAGLEGVQQQQCYAYFAYYHPFSVRRDAPPSRF